MHTGEFDALGGHRDGFGMVAAARLVMELDGGWTGGSVVAGGMGAQGGPGKLSHIRAGLVHVATPLTPLAPRVRFDGDVFQRSVLPYVVKRLDVDMGVYRKGLALFGPLFGVPKLRN